MFNNLKTLNTSLCSPTDTGTSVSWYVPRTEKPVNLSHPYKAAGLATKLKYHSKQWCV